MGATITRDEELHKKMKRARMRLGVGVSSDDASLVLRSLSSMKLRYEAHDRAALALALAQWLKMRPEISAVLHPAIADCPGHEFYERDFKGGAGSLFSVVFDKRYSTAQVDAFVEALALFSIGWGGSHSLAMPYDIRSRPHDGVLVRF